MATAGLLTGCAVPVASTSGSFSQTNTGSDISYDEYGYDEYGYDQYGYDDSGYDDSGYDDWEMGVDGDGYWVKCYDGEWSQSGGNSGACSQHGGLG